MRRNLRNRRHLSVWLHLILNITLFLPIAGRSMDRHYVPKGIFCRVLWETRCWKILEVLPSRRSTTSRCGEKSPRRNFVLRSRYLSRSDIQNQSYSYPRKTPSPLNKAQTRRSFIQYSSLRHTYMLSITYCTVYKRRITGKTTKCSEVRANKYRRTNTQRL